MSGTKHTYSPQDFLYALRRDEFAADKPPIIGIAKAADQDERILFSEDRVEWVPLELDMIESIEVLKGTEADGDGVPVRLYMKKPQSAEAEAYSRLVEANRRRRAIPVAIPVGSVISREAGRVPTRHHPPRYYVPGYFAVWCAYESQFVSEASKDRNLLREQAKEHARETGHYAPVERYWEWWEDI
ncbi:hypothetical protein OG250_26785 [Streptomyces sp. NBC_00487]|uniref:hypothetical protein n=1 Tax=unclassified Streptomyces TaxID=2593676 RepID=UPI002E17564E|nr:MULTISPECIES: hypothetical protein [unclassified Streptomyces]